MANPACPPTAAARLVPVTRYSLPTAALAVWCAVAAPAYAQEQTPNEATAILNTWAEGLNALEGVTASFKSVKAGDTSRSATLTGGKISYSLPNFPWFAQDGGSRPGKLSLSVSFDEMDFAGLRETGDRIEADTIAIPGTLDVRLEVEAAPDEPKKISSGPEGSSDASPSPSPQPQGTDNVTPDRGDSPALTVQTSVLVAGTMEASYQDVLIEDFSAPIALPPKPEGATGAIATARQWLEAFRQVRTARAFIAEVTSNSTTEGAGSSSSVYNDVLMLNLNDGRVAEEAISKFRVLQETPGPDGQSQTLDMSGGTATVRGVDLAPLAVLLGGPEEPGRTTLVDREELLDLTFSADGAKGRIASVMLEDMTLADPSKAKLVGIVERTEKGETVPEEETGMAVLSDMGKFSLGRMEFNGLEVESPEVSAQLRRFLLKELSGTGLGEVSIDGLQIQTQETPAASSGNGDDAGQDTAPPATSVFLDHAGIFRVGFPSAAALSVLGTAGEPTPEQIQAAMPTIGKMIVSALEVTLPDDSGKDAAENTGEDAAASSTIRLNLAELLQGGFTNKIPTRSSFVIDGLTVPASQITDQGLRGLLDQLGIEELEFNQSFSVAWSPATEDLSLSNLTVELRGGGKASLSLELGNVPAMLFTSPDMAQVALAGAVIKSGRLRVTGEELISALLSDQAQETQLTEEQLADGFADALRGEIGPLAGTRFGEDLIKGFRSFLTNPDELSVVLEPKTPVGVAELLALAVTSPSSIPDRLEAKVISGAAK